MTAELKIDNLPSPGDRFKLSSKLAWGVWGILYEADDTETGCRVAVKVTNLTKDRQDEIREEYKVYKTIAPHENLAEYQDMYKKQGRADIQQVWVVTELCGGGTVGDYVRKMKKQNKRLPESHIAYIMRETVKAIVHLNENNIIHRNLRADSILLTEDGQVKLSNLGLCIMVDNIEDKIKTCLGAPCWMAPEVANCNEHKEHEGYDVRADVWSIGVTAIELGDGVPPLQSIHPARALFQITRNPPPALYRPANWTQLYNDFIAECLEKNPENRPHSQELLEHPFFESTAENEDTIRQEIADSAAEMKLLATEEPQFCDVLVRGMNMEQEQQSPQRLLQEDLAAMEDITEDTIIEELQLRAKRGQFYSFAGDVLLFINPHQTLDMYNIQDHVKYEYKARSDNAPHVYTVADKAYQDVLHNEEPQHILFAGETMSGKTANANHAINHLLYLGKGNACIEDIRRGLRVISAFGSASTPHNPNSTRHLLQTQVTFTTTGKVSGAIFWLYVLEKTRVTIHDKKHANFNIFYYFYDHLEHEGTLPQLNLEAGRDYRYLRTKNVSVTKPGVRETPTENSKQWKQIEKDLKDLNLNMEQLQAVKNILAAILLLGEIEFTADEEDFAVVSQQKTAETVATLLGVDYKKFSWALLNYCVIVKGEATRRRQNVEEANDSRDILAQGLYSRLLDWIVCKINEKLSVSRAIFGDDHSVSVTDLFGFECFSKNGLPQLFINCVNEQLQFHYNQRVFAWEMQEGEEEEIPMPTLPFYDNKTAIDQLLAKPNGLLYILDEASREGNSDLINEKLRANKASHVAAASGSDFTVAHYTGRVSYDAADFHDNNRDFLSPEMIETMRQSDEPVIHILFTGLFSKTGNLTVPTDPEVVKRIRGRWGAALVNEHEKKRARKYNTESRGQYSQTRQMRTASATFRGTCLEILKSLAGGCGVHFVRCLRGNLTDQPGMVQLDLLRQQMRALAVLDTARARQRGYSVRIPFNEFIRRYKFLAFDYDEQVDVTKDNCRLLLIRLKLEGWVIGKTKVFLKYYNEEFLNRLYETQVKKIVKVQSMMRAFLAKRNLGAKLQKMKSLRESGSVDEPLHMAEQRKHKKHLNENEAATIIQKQIRGSLVRKQYGPAVKAATGKLDEETIIFMKSWYKRWRLKSMFQVLLLYRATRHQDFVYFCQQAHLYNQNALSGLHEINEEIVELSKVDPKARINFLPPVRPSVHKLPFRLGDLPYFDSTYMSDPTQAISNKSRDQEETWDAPLQRNIGEKYKRSAGLRNFREMGCQTYVDNIEYSRYAITSLPETPYVRDTSKAVKLPPLQEQREFKPRLSQDTGRNQIYRGGSAVKKQAPPPPPAIKVPGGKPVYGPINEMQDKFRSEGDEDEPPFNFQAMLRKTNNKRQSLKRADEGFITPTKDLHNRNIYNDNRDRSTTVTNNNGRNPTIINDNVVFTSDNFQASPVRKEKNGNEANVFTPNAEAMELAPGLVIHGEVADL